MDLAALTVLWISDTMITIMAKSQTDVYGGFYDDL